MSTQHVLAALGHPSHWPKNTLYQGPGQADTKSITAVSWPQTKDLLGNLYLSVLWLTQHCCCSHETRCLASKSPKYNHSPITTRFRDRCRKLRTCRIKRQNKAQQNARTTLVFLYKFVSVLPQAQIASLIHTTVPASCAAWVSITSCHLGKQLQHRKAKGIKGMPPVFTVARYKIFNILHFQSSKFVWFGLRGFFWGGGIVCVCMCSVRFF